MIKLNFSTEELKKIQLEYLEYIKKFFQINDQGDSLKINKIIGNKKRLEKRMLKWFFNHLGTIILAPTSKFEELENQCYSDTKYTEHPHDAVEFNRFKEKMVGFYNNFFSKIVSNNKEFESYTYGRWFTKRLGLTVCPYCNNSYIFTINEKRDNNNIFTRPQLDHYLPKSKHPLFALSFYNLIPSCYVCNTIKKDIEISFSPYDTGNQEEITFKIESFSDKTNLHEWILNNNKINVKTFHTLNSNDVTEKSIVRELGLDHIYEQHVDYVSEIMNKAYAYNKDSYEGFIKSYNGLGKTPEQIDNLIWGVFLDEHSKRPLSKFTHDILIQLGIKKSN